MLGPGLFAAAGDIEDEAEKLPATTHQPLTGIRRHRKMAGMEVHFSSDLEAKLARMAAAQGRATETLVQEAVERSLDYDEWFLREVEKGLAAADCGEFVEHSDIRKMIDSRYSG